MDHAVCDHFLKDGGSFTQQAVRLDVSDIFFTEINQFAPEVDQKVGTADFT